MPYDAKYCKRVPSGRCEEEVNVVIPRVPGLGPQGSRKGHRDHSDMHLGVYSVIQQSSEMISDMRIIWPFLFNLY